MTFRASVLTLYPEMFPGPLGVSLAGRGLAEGTWSLETIQIRDFATDRHRSVDDTPAGGGAGMVMRADVLARAGSGAVRRSTREISPRGRTARTRTNGRRTTPTSPAGSTTRSRAGPEPAGPDRSRARCGRRVGIEQPQRASRATSGISAG